MDKELTRELSELYRRQQKMDDLIFETYLNKLMEITEAVVKQDFFESSKFAAKKSLAKQIHHLTVQEVEVFLNVVKGLTPGTVIGLPENTEMCFPRRFLKRDLFEKLPYGILTLVELIKLIDCTFYLGFAYHEIFTDFPTRNDVVEKVHTGLSFEKYYTDTLIASVILKNYYESTNEGLAEYIFESYYKEIKSFLREDLKIGFVRRTMCRSFLRNLYLSGSLMGMRLDLATCQNKPILL
ncbi:MAG: hypothetical protein GX338_09250 [Firmicutes bacterium]|nr:hypothetical protein [Bacillota bacterium]